MYYIESLDRICQEEHECPQRFGKQKNKHQVRTEETQAKILAAAEATFSERGFESAQLEDVAARAGYTRGAIYAHYASKEDLFLALMEHRVLTKFVAIRKTIEAEPDISSKARNIQALADRSTQRSHLGHSHAGVQTVCTSSPGITGEAGKHV